MVLNRCLPVYFRVLVPVFVCTRACVFVCAHVHVDTRRLLCCGCPTNVPCFPRVRQQLGTPWSGRPPGSPTMATSLLPRRPRLWIPHSRRSSTVLDDCRPTPTPTPTPTLTSNKATPATWRRLQTSNHPGCQSPSACLYAPRPLRRPPSWVWAWVWVWGSSEGKEEGEASRMCTRVLHRWGVRRCTRCEDPWHERRCW